MKKFLIAGAALAAFAATAVPASAAPYSNDRGWNNGYQRSAYTTRGEINRQQAQISQRIEMGQRNGSISYREATRLRAELRNINYLEARYERGGLNRNELADLDRRLDSLSRQVFVERHDRNDRRG
jgi:hypothetical protein